MGKVKSESKLSESECQKYFEYKDFQSQRLTKRKKMPKKFKGENSKAVEARARKEEKATSEKEKKQKAIDDAYWQDDNKQLQKKQAKKEDAERKRLEALEKKKQREELLAQEDAENKSQAAKKGGQAPKMSRAQIREDAEKRNAIALGKPKEEV